MAKCNIQISVAAFLKNLLNVSQHDIINEVLWFYGNALTYKSCSLELREPSCLIWTPQKHPFFQANLNAKNIILTKIVILQ